MAEYTKLFLLGSGSYGKAWVVHKKDDSNDKNVLKEVNLSNLNEKDIKQAVVEAELLAECKHENIIRCKEAFVSKETLSLCIVMEYATCGDLHKYITHRNGLFFPNETVHLWLGQIMSALDYIHSRGILHRDVKPQNLFLTNQQTLKLGDFGIARILEKETDKALTFIGTPFYISPEIYNHKPYSFKSDMWSAGCVVYELCCLHLPFSASSLSQLAAKVERGVYSALPSHCDETLHLLVEKLLNPDPEERPTAKDVLDLLMVKEEESYQQTQSSDNSDNEMGNSCDRGRHRSRQDKNRPKVNSRTYTIAGQAKAKRGSLASPELSLLIHHQRIQSAERNRASSVDNIHKSSQSQKKTSPKFNLLQTSPAYDEVKKCNIRNKVIESNTKSSDSTSLSKLVGCMVYEVHQTSPFGLDAKDVRRCLETVLRKEDIDRVVKSVKDKKSLTKLRAIPNWDCSLLPLVLLYISLAGIL